MSECFECGSETSQVLHYAHWCRECDITWTPADMDNSNDTRDVSDFPPPEGSTMKKGAESDWGLTMSNSPNLGPIEFLRAAWCRLRGGSSKE